MDYTFHKVQYFPQVARKLFICIYGEKPKIWLSEQSSCVAKLEITEDKALEQRTQQLVCGVCPESIGSELWKEQTLGAEGCVVMLLCFQSNKYMLQHGYKYIDVSCKSGNERKY